MGPLLMVMVQLGQGSHTLNGLHLSASPDPPSRRLVMQREGKHIRAWVQCVVACMLGREHDDAQGKGRRNIV